MTTTALPSSPPPLSPPPRLALIDVLDRDGRARQSISVTRWPVRIGRALDNDLVLDDPGVAAHHCTLTPHAEKPAIALQVGDTRNGVLLGRTRLASGSEHRLAHGQEWQAGQTRLRLRLAQGPLAPEQAVAHAGVGGLLSGTLAVLALAGLTGISSYLDSVPDKFSISLTRELLIVGLLVALWSLLWSLSSKMFRHQMLYWQHLRIAAWGTVATQLGMYALGGLSFALSIPILSRIQPELPWLVLMVMLYAHLMRVLPRHRRVVAGTSVLLCLGLLATHLSLRQQETCRWFAPLYASSLAHPALRLAPAEDVSTFLQGAATLEAPLQTAARQNNHTDDEDELELEGMEDGL